MDRFGVGKAADVCLGGSSRGDWEVSAGSDGVHARMVVVGGLDGLSCTSVWTTGGVDQSPCSSRAWSNLAICNGSDCDNVSREGDCG